MTHPIPASQLVLNKEGAVYHLNLLPEHLADDILLVGDPGRVAMVSSFFDSIEVRRQNRELVTHTGHYKGKRITVLSTGMGTDNIDIVVNELDALANIDLNTKTPKQNHRSLNIIRLGTCGALQEEIAVEDSYIATRYALGLDGLLYFYDGHHKVNEIEIRDAFIKHLDYPKTLPMPYVVQCSEALFNRLTEGYVNGITATAPGFYGPQGRSLRLNLSHPQHNSLMESFRFNEHKICNFEMESSALYGLGRLLGHNCLTICVAIANRVSEKFATNYRPYVEKLIQNTLDRLIR